MKIKSRILKERKYFNFADMQKAEKAMCSTWELMREDLSKGSFAYNEIAKAKECKFLSVFDSLFVENKGFEFFEINLIDVFKDYHIVRGTIIKDGEPMPNYERLLPKSEYITDDNRFSPKGVEWLYLALGSSKTDDGLCNAKKCSEAECRAKKGTNFAICFFDASSKSDVKIVDLTVGNHWRYEKLQKDLECAAKRIVRRETKKYLESFSKPSTLDFIPEFRKWLVYTYAMMLSEQIFVPVDTDNKSLMYAPFQCIAQYFLSLGYNGIIYKSTVYDKGKNLVLFDKNLVTPVGDIELYNI
ncbi:MAG: RES domain-containing protein [Ruminococcus sp.]|nr:RES domain-containing protein [Ruminococcus sp.]